MPSEGYGFLDSDYKKSLPALVLGIEQLPPHWEDFQFKADRQWLKIQHQTAGYACHQHYLDGIVLAPREPQRIKLVSDKYLDSCMAMWGLTLDEVLDYRATIQDLFDVDCNYSFMGLEEGIYPIDCTNTNLKKLCRDRLPKELDKLVEWEDGIQKMCGCVGRWKLYILGENCD